MAQFTIDCTVKLSGATMLVEADSQEEALAKAKADEWSDILYNTAELVDWKITGDPVED